MTDLIYDDRIAIEVRALIKKSAPARIVAPYWGDRANEALGLGKTKLKDKLHLICNLCDPATDPEGIRDLLRRGAEVAFHPDIHAKIYLGQTEAIIGSANVSGIAFGLSGSGERYEMCTRVKGKAVIAELNCWWLDRWDEATTLTLGDATTERIFRTAKYVRDQEVNKLDLLTALSRFPKDFADVHVRVDWIRLDPSVAIKVDNMNEAHNKHGVGFGAFQYIDDLAPNAEVLAFFSDGPDKPVRFDHNWHTPEDPIAEQENDEHHAVYVHRLPSCRGYALENGRMLLEGATRFRDELVRDGHEGGSLPLKTFVKRYVHQK